MTWAPRYSLRTLLVFFTLTGVAFGLFMRERYRPRYFGRGFFGPGESIDTTWVKVANDSPKLCYLIVFPDNSSKNLSGSMSPGGTPVPKNLSLVANKLYNDGVEVETSETRKIFIYRRDRTLRPVELSKQELAKFDIEYVASLESQDLWHNKLKAIIEEEAW